MTWLDDPRLARRFARVTWIVIVTVFVVLTRGSFGDLIETAVLAAMLTAVCFLNAPTVVGLCRGRAELHTRAWRMALLALLMRLVATVFVLWVASP